MPLPSLQGQLLDGRYFLTRKIGAGAFGEVFEAQHLFLGEEVETVAVKLLSPLDDDDKIRVLEEVRAMARLSHPHLLAFRSAGEVDLPSHSGDLFLVMELASHTLEDELKNRFLDAENVTILARHIALALEYLSAHRCIHRDLKPANVLQTVQDWKIADFGLARTLENSKSHFSGVGGTPLYMAPEAWRGVVTPAVDVWALGAIIQVALTGKLPCERRKTQDEFIARVLKDAPFIAPGLPAPLDKIVVACLQKNPAARPSPTEILSWLDPKIAVDATPIAKSSPTEIPNEIFVAPNGAGDFPSVQDALDAAPDGAAIHLAPGTYFESLRCEKTLHLRAQPSYESRVTFEFGSGNVLKILGGSGTMHGIVFRGVAGEQNKRFHTVSAQGGEWEITRCDFWSDSLAGLHFGGQASLLLRDCGFASAPSDGISVSGGQKLQIIGGQSSGSGRHGLHLKNAPLQSLEIENFASQENRGNGVLALEGALEMRKCSVAGNARSGIELGDGVMVQISACKVGGNGAQGIVAARGVSGQIEGCDLSENRFGAYDVPRGCLLARIGNKE